MAALGYTATHLSPSQPLTENGVNSSLINTGWTATYPIAVQEVTNPMQQRNSTISGTVKDDTAANAVRTVRIYDRASGRYIGGVVSAADGTFSYRTPAADVYVVCLDDAAGTVYDDLILQTTPV